MFTECKTEKFLLAESKEQPERYVQQSDGTWRSPPAEAAAAELGCRFELRSTQQNNYIAHQNLEMLNDYYRSKVPEVPINVRQLFEERLHGKPFASAFDLIHREPRISADHLYAMLVAGNIYFPLSALRLAEQDTALFFRSQAEWRAHETFIQADRPDLRHGGFPQEIRANDVFTWNGVNYEVVNAGTDKLCARTLDDKPTLINLTNDEFNSLCTSEIVFQPNRGPENNSEAEERYRQASPADLQEARWRHQLLFNEFDKISKKNPLITRQKRIQYQWLKRYREAEVRFGNGFIGLLPNRHGNRSPKISPQSKALVLKVIEDDWETNRRKTRLLSYGTYCNVADEQGLDRVSYVTFCDYIKRRNDHAQKVSRVGEKAAYDLEPQYLELERTTPRHGTHSWHIGHIDHTPLPLKFVGSDGKGPIDTLWLSILTTGFDRKNRACYFSFDAPSYRSCMMVLRDCVRRHGRIPQYIVTDGGSDFNSVYFETFLARLNTKKRERAKGKPRFGSVCERIFGTTQTQFITNLLGATDIVEKYFRAISPEVDPKRHAVWVLDLFENKFEEYLENIYHKAYHSGIDMTPNEAEALSLRSHGERAFCRIPYDDQFIAESCPEVTRGNVKVLPEGVKINYRWHKGEVLHQTGVMRTSVPARYDPWDSGKAYVFVKGQWWLVFSEYYALFKGLSERSIRIATQALRLIARKRGEKAVVNAQNLAHFMLTTEGQEVTARQLRNDAEATPHRNTINEPTVRRRPASSVVAPAESALTTATVYQLPTTVSRRPTEKRPSTLLEDL